MGLVGPKKYALSVLKKTVIAVEKELKMQINLKKSGVEHHSDGALFLGYRLLGNYGIKYDCFVGQSYKNNRIQFNVPTKRLLKKYINKGFFQVAKKGKGIKFVARRVDK